MPKKLYPSEPAIIFDDLYAEALEVDNEFSLKMSDPTPELFADKLINEHFPPQSELPLA